MKQLAGSDSYWLYTESGTVYNHVGSLAIYDPSTAPGGSVRFKDILRYFGNRLDRSKVFRRRLATAPHDLDRPYWLEDPDLDLEFHIRHIALPEPGDWRQLMIQAARIHSRPLDRSHPLWEAYVIEGLHRIPGLPKGSFAIQMKFHHSAIDGQAGAELVRAVHSLTPDIELPAEQPTLYTERDPTALELYSRAAVHTVERGIGIGRLYASVVAKLGGFAAGQVARRANPAVVAAGKEPALPEFISAPKTRFNRRVSANRAVEAIAMPLAAMKTLRNRVEGVTVNDIFLTVVGGALRRYLESKHELPERSLMALMPMSVRREGAAFEEGNQVGGVPVRVHSDIPDALDRLRAVHADAQTAKQGADMLGRDFLKQVMDSLPHYLTEKFLQYYVYPQLNVTVSNVRGPDVPLYVAGARLVHFYPLSIATDFVGLNHTGFSYNGVLWLSVVACRNMLPDPAFYADCLRASFDELVVAGDALPERALSGTRARRQTTGKAVSARPRKQTASRGGEALGPRGRKESAT